MKIKTTFSVAIYHLFIYCCFDVRVGAFYPPFPKKTCILMLSHWQKKKTKLSQISAVPVFQGLVFQETGNKQKIFSATQCSLLSNTNQIFLYLNCSISPVFWVKAILAKSFTAVSSLCSIRQQRAQLPAETPEQLTGYCASCSLKWFLSIRARFWLKQCSFHSQ